MRAKSANFGPNADADRNRAGRTLVEEPFTAKCQVAKSEGNREVHWVSGEN
jgi:hypothetical protein